MWTQVQRQRLATEHQILQNEGFTQFSVYHLAAYDTYYASGLASSSSGKSYSLWMPIPSGFPAQRPKLYIIDPNPLRTFSGTAISTLGVSHAMHTLDPHEN